MPNFPFPRDILDAQEALAAAEAAQGPDHPALIPLLNELSELYSSQRFDRLPREIHQRILEIQSKILEPGNPDLEEAQCRVSGSEGENGKASRKTLEDQVKTIEKDSGINASALVPVLRQLAKLYEYREPDICEHREPEFPYRQVIIIHERIFAIQTATLGADHPDTIDTMLHLAWKYDCLVVPDKKQQEIILRQALKLLEDKYGMDSQELTTVLRALARCLDDCIGGECLDGKQAVEVLKRVLQIDEKTLGPEHLCISYDLSTVATQLVHGTKVPQNHGCEPEEDCDESCYDVLPVPDALPVTAKPDDAEWITQARDCLTRAIAIRQKCYGQNNLLVAECLKELSGLEDLAGNIKKAEELMVLAVAIQEKFLPVSEEFGSGIGDLIKRAKKRNDDDKLAEMYRWQYEAYKNAFGPDDVNTMYARDEMEAHVG